ncbi:MAG: acetoacetyl-CoA reductase [Pseudomonadota bacterium]
MGRLAFVTGGTRGIGAAISRTLHKAGYMVVAGYYSDSENANKFSMESGIPVKRFDVSDYIACDAAVRESEKEFGVPVSILVNNAGITKDAMLHKMDPSAWSAVIDTNLTSCFNMCRSVIIGMREQNYGRIINISSVNAQAGQAGQVNYSAAKAGIIGLTKALARESAAKGITVNAIAPGYVMTDMLSTISSEIMDKIVSLIPLKRVGMPDEIARAVVFLAAEEAGFITGETISINGGHNML